MHVRPARAGAQAVATEAAVRGHEPAVRRAGHRRPAAARRRSSASASMTISSTASRRSTSSRSASTAGSAIARPRASAGATILTMPASRRPSRSPTGCIRCARKQPTFAGVAPDDFAHVLLARYDPGAGIGWHRDRPHFEQVVGISLGAPAIMRFRQRTALGISPRARAARAALGLSALGRGRHDWEHSIAPGEALRFSITFRTLSEKGRRLAERAA